jgi:N-acetylmuramoyl-L-alanine amidase/fibronectin type 3 domain-containing protein
MINKTATRRPQIESNFQKSLVFLIFSIIFISFMTMPLHAAKITNGTIQYAYVDTFEVKTPSQQHILIGVGKEGDVITDAALNYHKDNSEEILSLKPSDILEEALLFTIAYDDPAASGIYQLDSVSYQANGTKYHITMKEAKLDIQYGVNQTVAAKPDTILAQDKPEDVVTVDQDGSLLSDTTIAAAVSDGEAALQSPGTLSRNTVAATGANNTVVVLDAGHGGSDPGAIYQGVQEKDLNLKIAQYAKAELDTYANVQTYLTRSTDVFVDLYERVAYAQGKRANVFVSLHNNASSNTSARGAGVFLPNESYRPDLAYTSHALSEIILSRLVALGLEEWGLFYRNSEVSQYADGSWKDYYAVIRASKEAGFIGIIVEHAFMSNTSDMKQYLNNNTKLKNLGIADAKAIADYYHLKKKVTAPPKPVINTVRSESSNKIHLSWGTSTKASGYIIYRSSTQAGGYQRIAKIESGQTGRYIDKAVSPKKTYFYKIRAYKTAYGATAYSPYARAVGAKVLSKSAINSVPAQAGASMAINWNKITDVTGYQIQRSTSPTSGFTKIATIKGAAVTNYLDGPLKTNTLYYYRLRAFKYVTGGTSFGAFSPVISGKAVAKVPIIAAQSQSSKKIAITWKKVGGATAYQIFRSTKKHSGYQRITMVTSSKEPRYIDTVEKNNQTYYYKIRARINIKGMVGYGTYSKVLEGKSLGRVSITSVKSVRGGVRINWKQLSGGTAYQIYRSTKKTGSYKRISTTTSKILTFVDNNVDRREKYYYKVRALNRVNGKVGYSSFSKVLQRR